MRHGPHSSHPDRTVRGSVTWSGPLCPPTWRPAPHAARPSSAAAAPAPRLDLCYIMEAISETEGDSDRSGTVLLFGGVYQSHTNMNQCLFYSLWICECKSLVMTCSWPRLMSLMSPCLRFLFIKPSLIWGRCGSWVYRQTQTRND